MIPVTYSAACKLIVDAFEHLGIEHKQPSYWNDDAVSPVRKEIKDHYIADQKRRCCYCNRLFDTGHNAVWDGEHIIPRELAAKFMFEPRNLAASCKDCNNAKSDQEVRKVPTRVSFPDKSEHYRIVHPHFDEYSDHVRWWGELVQPLTQKGKKLSEMCNLVRFGMAKAGADILPVPPILADAIGQIMDPHTTGETMGLVAAMLAAHAESLKGKG